MTDIHHIGRPPVSPRDTTPEPGRPDISGRPTVVYIAGSGRSGSTLLERILGTLPGFVNVGEVNDMFRRMVKYDELCGCGASFSACSFWHQVGERSFGGWDEKLVDEVTALQRQVARQRHLMAMMASPLNSARFRASLDRYVEIHRRLYAGVLEVSGAQVVVDASKGAAQAMAISRGGKIDLRVLHLVRDARGVAFSWAKPDVRRPHGAGPRATMHSFRPQDTAVRWTLLQAEIAALRQFVNGSALVRYEDLVADPAQAIVRALAALQLGPRRSDLAHIDGTTVDLPPSHGLSGNPSRFRSGPHTLRSDEQWRRDMSAWDKLSTTAIAAGPLARYRYLPTARTRTPQ